MNQNMSAMMEVLLGPDNILTAVKAFQELDQGGRNDEKGSRNDEQGCRDSDP
jgi:hypothetical protein